MSNPDLTKGQPDIVEQGDRIAAEYPKEFFGLQIKFALRLSEVGKVPLGDALLYYTSLFRTFGAGRHLDRNNPDWQHFILAQGTPDSDAWTERAYKFYLDGKDKLENQLEKEYTQFGCFTYDYNFFEKAISIHFNKNDSGNKSPLSDEDLEQRKAELKQMFEHIKKHCPNAERVRGDSWLYNLAKYKRIFPSAYTANLEPSPDPYSNLNIWGQFLQGNRQIREQSTQIFKEGLEKATYKEEVLASFPLKALKVGCDIGVFYNELGIVR